MKLVIQRVSRAKVTSGPETLGEIGQGLMILCGVMEGDTIEDAHWLADKTVKLRIFTDPDDKLNLSLQDIGGGALVVSNFTLAGSCRRGTRPSFSRAPKHPLSEDLYEAYVSRLRENGITTATGRFGAPMEIDMLADGPITILMDSEERALPRHKAEE